MRVDKSVENAAYRAWAHVVARARVGCVSLSDLLWTVGWDSLEEAALHVAELYLRAVWETSRSLHFDSVDSRVDILVERQCKQHLPHDVWEKALDLVSSTPGALVFSRNGASIALPRRIRTLEVASV